MAVVDINWNPSRKELKLFAVLQVVFFVIVCTILVDKGGSSTFSAVIVGISAILGIAGWFQPAIVRPVYVGWMVAVFPIGCLVSYLILAAVFYLLFTPIGLIMKLAGKDPLQRKFDRTAKTYWQPRETPSDSSRYFRQF